VLTPVAMPSRIGPAFQLAPPRQNGYKTCDDDLLQNGWKSSDGLERNDRKLSQDL
jgi:hypothetical protein